MLQEELLTKEGLLS